MAFARGSTISSPPRVLIQKPLNRPKMAKNTLKNNSTLPKKVINIKTPYNGVLAKVYSEKSDLESETIPGQSYTTAELKKRYESGKPLAGGRVPQFYGDDFTHPDPSTMELTDRFAAIEEIRRRVESKKQVLTAEQLEIRKQNRQREIDAEVQKQLALKGKSDPGLPDQTDRRPDARSGQSH